MKFICTKWKKSNNWYYFWGLEKVTKILKNVSISTKRKTTRWLSLFLYIHFFFYLEWKVTNEVCYFQKQKRKNDWKLRKKIFYEGRYYCHIFIYTKSKTFNLCLLYFYMHLFFHLWIRKKTTPMCFIPTNCKIFN